VTETDTGHVLRYLAAVEDVEELAGSYCFDERARKLYLHPSDSAGVAHHLYSSPSPGLGIVLADHTRVEALVLTGFGDAAVRGINPTGAVVENCIAYGNGYGIEFQSGKECIIRNNEVWGNCSGYGEGAQIYIGCSPLVE